MGRRAVVLAIALLLAAGSAFAIFRYLNEIREAAVEQETQIPIFRAVQPILEGTTGDSILAGGDGVLYRADFEQLGDLPEGAIQDATDLNEVLSGKVAVGPIPSNGIITQSMWVAPSTEIQPLKTLIDAGKQAITISPGDVQGINGFAQPGDLVNVIVTVEIEFDATALGQAPDFGIPGDTGGGGTEGEEGATTETEVVPYTRYVLQNIEVLAVGQELVTGEDQPQSVSVEGEIGTDPAAEGAEVQTGEAVEPQVVTIYTLEVDPVQAEKLVFATQQGSIYMTLGPDDNQEVATQGVTIGNLFEGNLITDIFNN